MPYTVDTKVISAMSKKVTLLPRGWFFKEVTKFELRNGAEIYLRVNNYYSLIHTTVSQFSGISAFEQTIKLSVPAYSELKIIAEHLKVDLEGVDPSFVKTRIFPSRTRRFYKVTSDLRNDGRGFAETHHSFYFGDENRKLFVVYPAHERHPEKFLKVTTRIEVRNNCTKARHKTLIPETNLELAKDYWLIRQPFKFISFKQFKMPKKLTAQDIRKADHFQLKIEKFGVKDGLRRLRKMDKNFYRDQPLFDKCLEPVPIDLNAIYQKQIKDFFDTPVTAVEKKMLAIGEGARDSGKRGS